jgi:hypothetical protein
MFRDMAQSPSLTRVSTSSHNLHPELQEKQDEIRHLQLAQPQHTVTQIKELKERTRLDGMTKKLGR